MSARTLAVAVCLAFLAVPATTQACGRYGPPPIDSVVLKLADENPAVAAAGWMQLVALGDEGVKRLERAVTYAKWESRDNERYLDRIAQQADFQAAAGLSVEPTLERLYAMEAALETSKRRVATFERFVEPLRQAVKAATPTA